MKVYAVYDIKAKAFMQPFFAQHPGLATRSFTDAVSDGKSIFFRHPADFELFELAEWSEETGRFIPYDQKVSLGLAAQYLESK